MYSSGCPTLEEFEDLMANRFSAPEAEALRNHIRTCSTCAGKVNSPTRSNHNYFFLSPAKEEGELGWLGIFKILGVLGKGGMAVVFDAEDSILHRRVALKVLQPSLSTSSIRERFLREARLLASVNSDFVVRIYQVGEANDIPYLVMEKLSGESLERRLEKDGRLPASEALKILKQAAEGLQVAHQNGLIHRDIKPANLWLEKRDGKQPRVKLIDFGIARHMAHESNLTSKGQILGTPVYMSPEQAMGQPVDPRTDLYGLGAVLYHLVTGEPPIGTSAELQHHLREMNSLQGQIQNNQAFNIPQTVSNLIQQLMHTDPKQRPSSAIELVHILQKMEDIQHDPLVIPTNLQGNPEIQIPRKNRYWGTILGLSMVFLAIMVAGLAATYKILTLVNFHSSQPVTNPH